MAIKKQTTKKSPPNQESFMFMGVKFPSYFVNPRWVQISDMSFTIAIDNAVWNTRQRAMWDAKYLSELAKLAKQVLEKLTKSKVKPL